MLLQKSKFHKWFLFWNKNDLVYLYWWRKFNLNKSINLDTCEKRKIQSKIYQWLKNYREELIQLYVLCLGSTWREIFRQNNILTFYGQWVHSTYFVHRNKRSFDEYINDNSKRWTHSHLLLDLFLIVQVTCH